MAFAPVEPAEPDRVAWFFGKVLEYFHEPYKSWEAFVDAIGLGAQLFVSIDSKTGWLFLLSSVVVAGVVYQYERSTGALGQSVSLRQFLFPGSVYRHRSAVADYRFVAFDLTFRWITYGPVLAGVSYLSYTGTMKLREAFFPDLSLWLAAPLSPVVATVIFVLVVDFGFYVGHYLAHKIHFFWVFHQIHHSAEVLTPITVYRVHPVDEGLAVLASGVVSGVFATTYTATTGEPVEYVTVFGVNALTFAFYFFAYQLRHSHIWLSYGPLVSRILISPAQHQIHHSRETRHHDKNFGFMLAIWDGLFGTLYVPKSRETFELGVSGADPADFSTIPRLYFLPFGKAWRYVRQGVAGAGGRRSSAERTGA